MVRIIRSNPVTLGYSMCLVGTSAQVPNCKSEVQQMNRLTRLEECELIWSCGREFGAAEVIFKKRTTQEIIEKKTHSPRVQSVNDLTQDTQGFVDG